MLKRIKRFFRELEPSVIREIIIVVIILIISVALSLPQFHEDMEALHRWEQAHQNARNMDGTMGDVMEIEAGEGPDILLENPDIIP